MPVEVSGVWGGECEQPISGMADLSQGFHGHVTDGAVAVSRFGMCGKISSIYMFFCVQLIGMQNDHGIKVKMGIARARARGVVWGRNGARLAEQNREEADRFNRTPPLDPRTHALQPPPPHQARPRAQSTRRHHQERQQVVPRHSPAPRTAPTALPGRGVCRSRRGAAAGVLVEVIGG